jgi:hypothetical protein
MFVPDRQFFLLEPELDTIIFSATIFVLVSLGMQT